MKAKEVLKILNITRPTLSKYVKEGLILIDSEVNGQYNYNAASVNALLTNKEPVKKESNEFKDLIDSFEDVLQVLAEVANLDLLSPAAITRIKTAYNRIIKYQGE